MIDDCVAGVANSQTVVAGAAEAGTDSDVLQNPVLGEVGWCVYGLILVGGLVGDQTADGDPARRGLARDGDVAVGEMDLGVDDAADLEQDVPGAGLVDGPLQ